jgi:hypothetical protein
MSAHGVLFDPSLDAVEDAPIAAAKHFLRFARLHQWIAHERSATCNKFLGRPSLMRGS